MNFERSGRDQTARTPVVLPSGKFEGAAIASIPTDDLRTLAGSFFRRDAVLQRAILAELARRDRRRRVPRERPPRRLF